MTLLTTKTTMNEQEEPPGDGSPSRATPSPSRALSCAQDRSRDAEAMVSPPDEAVDTTRQAGNRRSREFQSVELHKLLMRSLMLGRKRQSLLFSIFTC